MLVRLNRAESSYQVYGLTDAYCIHVLEPHDPLPMLTQQEERFHGALLGNTTFGLCYLALAQLEFRCPPDQFSFIRYTALPPEATDEACNVEGERMLQYLACKMRRASLHAQESVAKYIAFLEAGVLARQDSCATDVIAELRRQLDHATQCYPALSQLRELLGDPLLVEPRKRLLTRSLAYMIGKAALSTTELHRLSDLSIRQLRERVLAADFMDAHTPDKRLAAITGHLGTPLLVDQARNDPLLPRATSNFYERLIDALTERGITSRPCYDSAPLRRSAIAIGTRLHYAFYLSQRYFGMRRDCTISRVEGDWPVVEICEQQNAVVVADGELSFRIYSPRLLATSPASAVPLAQLRSRIEDSVTCVVVAFDGISKTRYRLHLALLYASPTPGGRYAPGPVFRLDIEESEIPILRDALSPKRVVVLGRATPGMGLHDFYAILAGTWGRLGRLVFLREYLDLLDFATSADSYMLHECSMSPHTMRAFNQNLVIPLLGLLRLSGGDSVYGIISKAPLYAGELVNPMLYVLHASGQTAAREMTLAEQASHSEWLECLAAAFEVCYRFRVLPEPALSVYWPEMLEEEP